MRETSQRHVKANGAEKLHAHTHRQGLWFAGDLDKLAEQFDKWGTKYFVLSWNSTFDFGTEFYSIITYVLNSAPNHQLPNQSLQQSSYIGMGVTRLQLQSITLCSAATTSETRTKLA